MVVSVSVKPPQELKEQEEAEVTEKGATEGTGTTEGEKGTVAVRRFQQTGLPGRGSKACEDRLHAISVPSVLSVAFFPS